MYDAYCDQASLDLSQCDNGRDVFSDRICDGIRNDCEDGSDEGSQCLTDPNLSFRYGCCRTLVMMANLGFIYPGLWEDVYFDPPTWDNNMKRTGLKCYKVRL